MEIQISAEAANAGPPASASAPTKAIAMRAHLDFEDFGAAVGADDDVRVTCCLSGKTRNFPQRSATLGLRVRKLLGNPGPDRKMTANQYENH